LNHRDHPFAFMSEMDRVMSTPRPVFFLATPRAAPFDLPFAFFLGFFALGFFFEGFLAFGFAFFVTAFDGPPAGAGLPSPENVALAGAPNSEATLGGP
jgi:hypothetical protein